VNYPFVYVGFVDYALLKVILGSENGRGFRVNIQPN